MIDAGADAVIGGHPHVTQDIEHHRGRPIIYSVGNFVMKETDIDAQRRGWVVRLELDAHGVRSFDTHVARLDREGIPTLDVASSSPCWRRGDTVTGLCFAGASK
jgi:poly-gamma-glutamate synthesis protein (capsule biosynthesis protein)